MGNWAENYQDLLGSSLNAPQMGSIYPLAPDPVGKGLLQGALMPSHIQIAHV